MVQLRVLRMEMKDAAGGQGRQAAACGSHGRRVTEGCDQRCCVLSVAETELNLVMMRELGGGEGGVVVFDNLGV